jgi:hypothetical protein
MALRGKWIDGQWVKAGTSGRKARSAKELDPLPAELVKFRTAARCPICRSRNYIRTKQGLCATCVLRANPKEKDDGI